MSFVSLVLGNGLQLADDQAKAGTSQPKRLKKMYVLGALLIEQYHESIKQRSKSKNKGKRGAEVSKLELSSFLWFHSQS